MLLQGSLEWTVAEQTRIFTLFYAASFVSTLLASYTAARFSAKKVVLTVISMHFCNSLLGPYFATHGGYGIFLARYVYV